MTAPVRLTKARAAALLEMFEKGVDSEIDSLQDTFGARVRPTGEVVINDDDFVLLDDDEAASLRERLHTLRDARAAAEIFARRYA